MKGGNADTLLTYFTDARQMRTRTRNLSSRLLGRLSHRELPLQLARIHSQRRSCGVRPALDIIPDRPSAHVLLHDLRPGQETMRGRGLEGQGEGSPEPCRAASYATARNARSCDKSTMRADLGRFLALLLSGLPLLSHAVASVDPLHV